MFSVVGRVIMSGQDAARFASDLLGRVRDLLVLSAVPNALEQGLVEIPESQIDGVLEQAGTIPPATLTRFTQVLSDGLRHFRGVTSPRLLLEVLCARMLLPATEDSVESLLQRVEALEHGRPALADGSGAATPAAAPVSSDAGAAEASPMQSGQSAREAWRQRNAQRKKGAQSASVTQRGRTEQAAPAQAPSQPQPQPEPQPKVQSEPVKQQSASAAAVSQESAPEPKPAPEAPTAPAEQPEQPTQATPAESVEQPQQAEQPQQPESAEQPLSEEEAQAEKIREFRRKMAEHARISEQQTRAQLAQEREQQTREREGEGGSMSIVEEEPVVSSSPTHSEQPTQPTQSPESQPEPQVQQAPEPAPQPEPTPQPEPEPAPAGIEQIRERWQEILEAVDGQHAFPIRVLAEQAVPLDVENDRLIIGHSTGALATRLNTPDYEQALSAAVKQVTGFNGQVHCVVGTRPRAPRSTATGGVSGEDDSSSRGSSSPNDTDPAPTPAAPAQPETSEQQVQQEQQEQQAQPEPAPRPQRSSAYASVAERRAKIEAAKRAAMGQQAGHDQPAQPHQQSQPNQPAQPSQPTQPNPNPVHQQQPNQPQPQSFLRAAQANAQANAQAQANQDSGFGGVPLPPEPMEEFAPPEGAEGAGGYGSRTPPNANTTYNPVSQNPQDNNYEEDTSEYFEAANEVGSLDHRSLKDVVMEMLEKELGAKPLEDR